VTHYTLLSNLWRLHLSYIISHHHNIQDFVCLWLHLSYIFSHHHNIQDFVCLFVRIKSEKWSGNCHWKLYIFYFSCDIYIYIYIYIYTGIGTLYVAVLQECLHILPWFMNNWQFPFLLYASWIFPDKKMESAVKIKLSLGTFLCYYARIFCHMWTIMCREYGT
jgi:hypothetical protein